VPISSSWHTDRECWRAPDDGEQVRNIVNFDNDWAAMFRTAGIVAITMAVLFSAATAAFRHVTR